MSKTKTPNKQRYRPVSEFDEVTLACKREYWRTRKREQRARQSMAKRLSKSPNTGICKPAVTVTQTNKHAPDIPHSQFSPTFLNSAGSYQADVTQNLTNSYRLTPENNFETQINHKRTCCEKTKLNNAVHRFPERSTESKRCMVIQTKDIKSPEEPNVGGSSVKCSGMPLTNGLPVPTAFRKEHANVTATLQTHNRLSAFNNKLSDISQRSAVSRFTPECNQQKKPQINSCLPPRPSAFAQGKVNKDQHILGGRGASPKRKACAYIPESCTAQGRTADIPLTEEEKAAKRRENWRIKKREQRAKRAEKLKKDKERTQSQCFENGQQKTGKLSCVVPTCSLLSVNTLVPRESKQPNSVKPAGQILSDGKPVHFTNHSSPSQKQFPNKNHSAKVDAQMAKNLFSVSANRANHLQYSKPSNLSISSGFSLQSSSTTQATNQSKIQQQNLVQVQKRQSLPHSFSQRFPQQNDRVETAEERHAKQREYWRIKKRLQRARLSVEAKSRLKERDALKRCALRFQSNLEQVRKTQTGFQRPNKNTLNASGTTSGFIKEDGTVSVPISKTSAEILRPATSCSVRAVKSSYLTSPRTSLSQKPVCVRTRTAARGITNRMNSSVNIQQRSTDQNTSTVDSQVRSKPASSTADADVLTGSTEASKGEEPNQEDRTDYRKKLRSSYSSSDVTPSFDLVPHDTIKQEPSYPSIESVYSLAEQSHSMDNKDIKPLPSSPPETKVEKEASPICDNQATTLLVVASMKKLLEESLSSVADTNTSFTDQDALLPCKTEQELSPQETETSIKPDIISHHGAVECNFSGFANPSLEVKQSPTLCHSPPQAPGFSAEDTVLSCQGSLLEAPHTVTTERLCFSQGPENRTHDLSVAASVTPVHTGTQGHSGKTAGSYPCCPLRASGGQQLNERSELQKKREYWRIMKRRQRARKAKEKERSKYAVQHKQLSQPIQRKCISSQVQHQFVAKPASHTNLNNHSVLPVVPLRPTRLVLSPTASNQQSNQQSSNGSKAKFSETSQVKKWHIQASAPMLSSRPDTVTSTLMNHVKPSGPQVQIRRPFMTNLKNKSRFKATANQELDPEEILRRKRMHWRIKKQEQRARKAARERELVHTAKLCHSGLDSSNKITELVQSTPSERLDYLPQCQDTSFKDEAELCFVPGDDCTDEPLSEAKWRNTYLMDYDPINQLLVCMVCGQQQYCLSVEGVKAHIEEAHPGTLSLEERERQGILQAWDEQIAVRERFFTNQLWQQSNAPKEVSQMHTAEIEVILDADDKANQRERL
ncbi:uncharacterized protein si:dkey-28a3.2 [Colossoma macropomum]|uniref:uncharacterized protein si:dkey-28a3.2 n=1 Tax=Colossoma macropomum TaxID=42526 RepID=UPI0018654A0F|nr:uncharacterized protein si:dkey-28a3.2 [Colossoma macropomum]XP_036453628.1 uncharacterized protein si:dkey-28a3.2 [Colossoma macropomum]